MQSEGSNDQAKRQFLSDVVSFLSRNFTKAKGILKTPNTEKPKNMAHNFT